VTTPQPTVSPRRAPGFTVSVPTNKFVEIARNLDSGTLINNTDANNAVWLSSSQTVRPGNGIRLGAFGTVQWLGGPCYAIIDTGVATAVTLGISNEMQDLVNPVDVASATAAKLLLQGVPSVALTSTLYNQSALGNGADTGIIDVSKYASLILITGGTQTYNIVMSFIMPDGTILIDNFSNIDNRGPGFTHAIQIPLGGATSFRAQIASGAGSTILLTIEGTNRFIEKAQFIQRRYFTRLFNVPSANYGAGSIQVMITGDLHEPYWGWYGQWYYRVVNSGAGTGGTFGYQYIDIDGTTVRTVYIQVTAAAAAQAYGIAATPLSVVQMHFQTITAGIQTASLQATPALS
jgi:hypothetical protein